MVVGGGSGGPVTGRFALRPLLGSGGGDRGGRLAEGLFPKSRYFDNRGDEKHRLVGDMLSVCLNIVAVVTGLGVGLDCRHLLGIANIVYRFPNIANNILCGLQYPVVKGSAVQKILAGPVT